LRPPTAAASPARTTKKPNRSISDAPRRLRRRGAGGIDVRAPEPAIELRSDARPPRRRTHRREAKPVELPVEDVVVPLVRPSAELMRRELEVAARFMSASDLEARSPRRPRRSRRVARSVRRPPGVLDQKRSAKKRRPSPRSSHAAARRSGKLPGLPELFTPIVELARTTTTKDITGVHHTPAGERQRSTASTDDALAQSGEHAASPSPQSRSGEARARVIKPAVVAAAGSRSRTSSVRRARSNRRRSARLLDAALKL
jgi:hypothetical protein